jgi:Flp pilus assembly pilin Flp
MRVFRVFSFRAMRAQGLVEYGLSVALLSFAAAGIMKLLGTDIGKAFKAILDMLGSGG